LTIHNIIGYQLVIAGSAGAGQVMIYGQTGAHFRGARRGAESLLMGRDNNKFNNKHHRSITMKSMEKLNVTAIIWQEDDVYVSKCPELEVASAGDTPEEALENLKEAVKLYLENAKALGILNDFAASLHSPNKFTSWSEQGIMGKSISLSSQKETRSQRGL
jgi:predicted RNase H-like HicB family nuclease